MLVKHLKYTGKPDTLPAKTTRVNILPVNGSGNYALGDTIQVNIPCRNNLVLDAANSYLKFNVQFTTGAASSFRFDSAGAHSVIQSIHVYSGSSLLEKISEYSSLAKLLMDMANPSDAVFNKFNVISGTRNDLSVVPNVAAVPTLNEIAVGGLRAVQTNSGESITALAGAGTTDAVTYCLNLFSILGKFSQDTYFPLFAATGSGLRLEIVLHQNPTNIICSNAAITSMVVSNCEYVASMIELSDTAMAIIKQSVGDKPLSYALSTYRNSNTTASLAAGNNNIQVIVPARYSSLKNLLATSRDKYQTLAVYGTSSVVNGLTEYSWRIGSDIYPQKAPNTKQEMFCELSKCFNAVGETGSNMAVDKIAYNLATSATQDLVSLINGSSNSGSFCLGLNLEAYGGSHSSLQGLDTNQSDIQLNLTYATAVAGSMRYDVFAEIDQVMVFENGSCYIKF